MPYLPHRWRWTQPRLATIYSIWRCKCGHQQKNRSHGRAECCGPFGKEKAPNVQQPPIEGASSARFGQKVACAPSQSIPHALQHRPPMQFGGFPGQQPGFASFIVRGYSARAKMAQRCVPVSGSSIGVPSPHSPSRDEYGRRGISWSALRHPWKGRVPHFWATELVCTPGSVRPTTPPWLLEDPELEEAASIAGLPPTVVGWVDHVAIPICATTQKVLVGMIQRITAQIIQVIWQAGFKVNWDKGKTECLANFRGPGAPQVRKEIFIEQQGKSEIETPHGLTDSPQSQVVGSYTHFGTRVGQDLNMAGEIDRQIGQAQTAFRMLQNPIFRNKRISIHTSH